jgi:cell division transport system permease protein
MLRAFHLGESLKEQVDVLVELREGTDKVARSTFEAALAKQPYFVVGSLEFRDKETALAEMGAEITQDLRELNLPNPFRDMLSFNVKADYLNQDSLDNITLQLGEDPVVLDVFYQDSFIDELMEKARRFGWILLGLGVVLVLIAMLLIHNTVRLSLYANRFLIKNQQLVGANWRFISAPYLRRAFWHGLLSGVLAAAVLLSLQFWLDREVPELRLFDQPEWVAGLYVGLILLGILINWLSHFFTVRRYLRMRADDLY